MLKGLLSVALTAGCAFGASATTLYLRTTSAADRSLELGEIASISFSDTAVTILLADETKIEVPANEFTSIRSNNGSGLSTSVMPVFDEAASWNIYTLNGVFVGVADDTDIKALPSGVYVFKSTSKTFKVIVP